MRQRCRGGPFLLTEYFALALKQTYLPQRPDLQGNSQLTLYPQLHEWLSSPSPDDNRKRRPCAKGLGYPRTTGRLPATCADRHVWVHLLQSPSVLSRAIDSPSL